MRLTLLSPTVSRAPSGGALVIYEYANQLAARGHVVTVVHSLHRRGPGLINMSRDLVGELRRGLRDGAIRRRITWVDVDKRVGMVFVDELTPNTVPDADVVIATYWTTAKVLAELAPRHGVQVHLIQAYETWSAPVDVLQDIWRMPVPKVVVSEALRSIGLELGINETLLRHIPNGIDLNQFKVRAPIATRPNRIAMLAHTSPVKGLDVGCAVLDRVRHHEPGAHAVAFGISRRPQILPPWVDYVRRPSRTSLSRDVYDRSAIYLCPARREGFGLTSAEAMASGCALVSTRNGGVDDFATDGETAMLTEPDDVAGLTAAVVHLLRQPHERMALASNGAASARRLSWEKSADSLEHYLGELVASTEAGSR